MNPDTIKDKFGIHGEIIKTGILAFSRREGEPYDIYLTRLKDTSNKYAQLSHLVSDKATDMINNCFDPMGLPQSIASVLLGQNSDLEGKVLDAVTLSRRSLQSPQLLIAA